MPHENLQTYRDGFFQKFLADLPGSPTIETLQPRQPQGRPLELMGDYIDYTGNAFTPLPNTSITPDFAIRTGSESNTRTYAMLWVVERIDVETDGAETMARILADFRPPNASGSAEDESLNTQHANNWAQALSSPATRQALARNLSDITEVPDGLPTSNLDELKSFLAYFCTYKPDGTYYTKGSVTEGEFPAGVSETYLAQDTGNLAEIRLQRDNFYCYAMVPEQLWNPQAPATRYRQLVYRIDDQAEEQQGGEGGGDQGQDATDRWHLALLHTVGATQPENTGSRFIFFHADTGLGLAVPPNAQSALDPATAALVDELPALQADLAATLADPNTPIVGTEQSPYVLLIGAVTEAFPATDLPEGVIADGEGATRTFRCPPQHVMALAERDDVDNLVLSTPVWPTMQQAKQEINLAGRTLPTGVTAANTGQGVLVGIVDSGIDGGHPAFLGRHDDPTKTRIHSVWNMRESGGQSPWDRSSSANKPAYRSMQFGREYIGHDEVTTVNDRGIGHGTHVAGIAAGRAFGTWPGGISPGATIVVAGVGTSGGYVNDVIAGVKYCFQKARELSLPCVVNISLGTSHHAHDGTDPLSIALTQLVSQNFTPSSLFVATATQVYLDGRIICASAGNNRGDNLHWQTTIPAGGEASVVYQPFGRGVSSRTTFDGVTFWAYNEDGTAVRLRISTRHATNALLATGEIPMQTSHRRVTYPLPGGLRVNLHNGPERPNNRHFNPEIYWSRPAPPPAPTPAPSTAPWIVRLRNTGRSNCVVHGFAAFREYSGGFIFDPAVTQPRIGVTYTPDQLRQFNSHIVSTPGTGHGTICVAAFTSRAGIPSHTVGELANFSSPGPLRAAAPGQRAIDVTMPGQMISSAKSWKPHDTSRGVVDLQGTSMASPMMTGAVAALLQMDPNLDTGQIRNRIEIASTRRATDSVNDWGLGRLNAAQFLTT